MARYLNPACAFLVALSLTLILSCRKPDDSENRDHSSPDTSPPETIITSSPPEVSDSATSEFDFLCDQPPCTFQCRLNGEAWRTCSPIHSFTLIEGWTPTALTGAPEPRLAHTAVWTGSEMIIWGGFAGMSGSTVVNTGGRYDLNTDSWLPTSTDNAPAARAGHSAVWTGSEMIIWGGADGATVNNSGAEYDPSTGSWTATTAETAPSARAYHSAVWTGTRMIVWGGMPESGLGSGGIYDPETGSWSAMSTDNSPSARKYHTAVWTGTEMMVWGGYDGVSIYLNSGGKYDPAADSWTDISTDNAPSARGLHSAVWTGSEMIVWGGRPSSLWTGLRSGGRYDPAADNWTATSTQDAPGPRFYHTAIWTGERMITWGGIDFNTSGNFLLYRDARLYDPVEDSWTVAPKIDFMNGAARHSAVWTGWQMIVWGGGSSTITNSGAILGLAESSHTFEVRAMDLAGNLDPTPALRTWTIDLTAPETSIASAPADPTASSDASFILECSEPSCVFECSLDGGDFGACASPVDYSGLGPGTHTFQVRATDPAGNPVASPASHTWLIDPQLPDTIITSHPPDPSAASTVEFGFICDKPPCTFECRIDNASWADCNSPQPFFLADQWSPISSIGMPSYRNEPSVVWTGSEMIIWGGYLVISYPDDLEPVNTGARYNPVTDMWTPITQANAPSARNSYSTVWTGKEMIIWGGCTDCDKPEQVFFRTGGRYDPATDSWTATDTYAAGCWRAGHSAIWTGKEMIVWGGYWGGYYGYDPWVMATDLGVKYDPEIDSWYSLVTGVNAPSERYSHTAVWTGTEMIIWGGMDFLGNYLYNGGRYDTETNSWSPMSSIDPIYLWGDRFYSFWTGTEMLVLGQYYGQFVKFAKYQPLSDAWTPIPLPQNLVDALYPSVVCTGNKMVFWGGFLESEMALTNRGTIYDLASEEWAPSSMLNAPEAMSNHAAVWTGDQMIVWDGMAGGARLSFADGEHTFFVRASNLAGNADPTPADYAWTEDIAPPDTTITSSPPPASNSNYPTFEFTSDQPSAYFECNIDSFGWELCESPVSYEFWDETSHNFQVRAANLAGKRDPSPASWDWTFDFIPPDASILSKPDNPTNSTDASFTFEGSELNCAFQCQLDAGDWEDCSSPKDYSALAIGSHAFQVMSTDQAGNIGGSEPWTWEIIE